MSLASKLRELVFHPQRAAQTVWRRAQWGSFALRAQYDAVNRPHYAYGIHQAAINAHRLGLSDVSVIEFGVAGGNGLIAMEELACEVEKLVPVRIQVWGFDLGSGLPAPVDYRDLPYLWRPGFYRMDEVALRARLRRAQLVLGDVRDTARTFFAKHDPAPVGFVAFDLDFYSSTKQAFAIFDAAPERLLPRVLCYFDDITGIDLAMHNDWVGELLAIREFNASHPGQKITPVAGLRGKRAVPAEWNDQIYAHHHFEHPLYCHYIVPSEDRQLALQDVSPAARPVPASGGRRRPVRAPARAGAAQTSFRV